MPQHAEGAALDRVGHIPHHVRGELTVLLAGDDQDGHVLDGVQAAVLVLTADEDAA
ncbi:hypothetical protein ACFXP3_06810 [Streptomyces sp. NPDC059096]|uniref:hypothetical protein n=1 Tax=Streptomyces sp. NPDC059096 TaxID=3346727 RepID=UPI00368586DB